MVQMKSQVAKPNVDFNLSPKYDSSTATDFELHESDETTVVYKILSYAGLVIKQPEISQVAEQKDNLKVQKEKS